MSLRGHTKMNRVRAAIVATALSCVGVACVPGFQGTGIDSDDTPSKTKKAAVGCGQKIEAQDPAEMPKCACENGGKARCVSRKKVPTSFADQLEECDDGVCVPDKLIKSGGEAPATCKSAFGEGRCMSLCIPEVGDKKDLLTRGEGDVCGSDERCVPCTDPRKGVETGVCDIGKEGGECSEADPVPKGSAGDQCPYVGPPLVDVSTFTACGGGMRCVPANLVPGDAAARLDTCAGGLCAPEKSIAAGGNYVPTTCRSVSNAEGRCLNVALRDVAAQAATLPQDVCDANEKCVPCFNPQDGQETGACRTVGCDAPKEGVKTFTSCCGGRAKCVPSTLVPASGRKSLSKENCASGELCAPNEQVENKPPVACVGSSALTGQYQGFCVSTCIERDFFEEMGTDQGTCPGGFFCGPCFKPSTLDIILGTPPSEPTGVPGCGN